MSAAGLIQEQQEIFYKPKRFKKKDIKELNKDDINLYDCLEKMQAPE